MTRMYKVVKLTDPTVGYEDNLLSAMHLREQYGLFHLSVEEVQKRWKNFSHTRSAGWLDFDNNPNDVELAFNVKLEKL